MGLENLKSVFNDLSKNSIDPISNANSPVSDLSKESDSFKSTPVPQIDSVFANKSLQLMGGVSLIDEEIPHSFGTNGANTELIKIQKIDFKSPDSPQSKQPSIDLTDEKVKKRQGDLFQNLGQNNQLGLNDLILEKLYNVNHSGVTLEDREPIDIGKVDENGNPVLINTLRSGMGDIGNLDIRGYSSGFRTSLFGPEPYVVKEIGSKVNLIGNNRDLLPFSAALDDVSRLAKYYTSGAGLLTIGKDLLYGGLFATNLSGLPNSLGQFSGGTTFTVPEPAVKLINTLNTVRLLTHTMAPAIPTINTGLLNFYGQALQSPGLESLRKPFAIGYSKLIGENDTLSPINQLQGAKSLADFLSLNKPYENPVIPIPSTLATKSNAKEYGSRTADDGDSASQKPTPFLQIGKNINQDTVIPYESEDRINKVGVVNNVISSTRINHGDFYVRIKDMRNGKQLYFRGFVTGITENVNPSFTSVNYIGRSEPVYLYERGDRDLSFNLRIYPNNPTEFDSMYEKLNYLTSLAYPEYRAEDNDSSVLRMKAPFTELYMGHIGTLDKGQFGFIKSLSYTVAETGDWDVDTNLPRLFDVAFGYQILNKKPPSLYSDRENQIVTRFYR